MKYMRSILQILLLITIFVLTTGFTADPAILDGDEITYSMIVNNKEVGRVGSAAKGLAVYDQVVDGIKARYDRPIELEGEVVFQECQGDQETLEESLAAEIEHAISIKIMAWGITIDGRKVCY